MKALGRYLWNILISIDQLVNTIFGGYPDETISSRIGKRVHWHGDTGWRLSFYKFLSLFDKDHTKKTIEEDEGERRD